ncbi:hypothetical protein P405_17440 [Streptomyces sp. FR-008]|nr:hypothetical protein P405_17440 [Streptomyces sp. FR-008]
MVAVLEVMKGEYEVARHERMVDIDVCFECAAQACSHPRGAHRAWRRHAASGAGLGEASRCRVRSLGADVLSVRRGQWLDPIRRRLISALVDSRVLVGPGAGALWLQDLDGVMSALRGL